jgi:hypothetical protein
LIALRVFDGEGWSQLQPPSPTTESDEEGRNLALAVVDADEEATLLCLRDAESR